MEQTEGGEFYENKIHDGSTADVQRNKLRFFS